MMTGSETDIDEIKYVNKDKELRDIIKKDLDRTMQDIEFFT